MIHRSADLLNVAANCEPSCDSFLAFDEKQTTIVQAARLAVYPGKPFAPPTRLWYKSCVTANTNYHSFATAEDGNRGRRQTERQRLGKQAYRAGPRSAAAGLESALRPQI